MMVKRSTLLPALGMLIVLILVLGKPQSVAANDLKELKEVRSGLSHAQDAVENLVFFLDQFLDHTTLEDTTTDFQTSSDIPTTIINTTPATETTPTTTTTSSTTTPTTTTSTTTSTTTTTTPSTTSTIPMTTTNEPTNPFSTGPSSEVVPLRGVLRVFQLGGLQGYRQALLDGGTIRGPKGNTARDLEVPLRYLGTLWKDGRKLPGTPNNNNNNNNKMEEDRPEEPKGRDKKKEDVTEEVDKKTYKKVGVIEEVENFYSEYELEDEEDNYNNNNDYYDDELTTDGTTTDVFVMTTIAPWWSRVNFCLETMDQLVWEVMGGATDHSHALSLDREAQTMTALVQEGEEQPEEVEEGFWTNYDPELIDGLLDGLENSTWMVEQKIDIAKDNQTEMIVTLTLLSVLFVLVLVGVIFALIRPGSTKSGLSKTQHAKTSGKDEVMVESSREFLEAKFVQRSLHIHIDPYKSRVSEL
ncbi:hypothetical protein Pcinc_031392 [Petrolisthes cinctipes]|uniref:Uncharacterized protein n=1 Tax=Petrolisthes cinctipes TaxID=88211 RepID=A0AAE1EW57_PETCI|nr:hypothetical protein Pcinc_031392 [Petrolisthes cinctipes]